MDIGQIVMKIAGREAGKLGVVIKKVDNNFVLVTGPKLLTGVKRRKANILHLEPTQHRLEVKEDATDEEVIEAFKKSGLVNKFSLKFPSAAEMKSDKAKEAKPKAEKSDKGKKVAKSK